MILVTGGNGFLGSSLCIKLQSEGVDFKAAVRCGSNYSYPVVLIDDLFDGKVFNNYAYSTVIHTAGRAHIFNDSHKKSLLEFQKVNVDGSLALATKAVENGVKRFIFISSVKACGDTTERVKPFVEDQIFYPTDPYGISKFEAEERLKELSVRTGLELVIIRPPLIYGEGVKANFLKVINLVKHGIPLPLGSINNLRSFISTDNLIDFILLCVEHPLAANETFFVSDGNDISTPMLIRKIAKELDVKSRIFNANVNYLSFLLKIAGKKTMADSLINSLIVDIDKAKMKLGWQPKYDMEYSIHKAVGHHK